MPSSGSSREGTSRWATVGLWVDWQEFEQLHLDRGLVVPKDENPVPWESMLYGGAGRDERVGYATSLMYSPVLQRHIGIARVLPEYAAQGLDRAPGDHRRPRVPHRAGHHRPAALYNPARKTGSSVELAPISYRMEQ